MTFEHIVQINDLTKPELPVLTRFQVWEGLVLRARRPDKFLVGVDDYEILDQGPAYLKRSLQLPGLQVVDEVTFWHEARIEYRTQPTATLPAATLVMDIEEPSRHHCLSVSGMKQRASRTAVIRCPMTSILNRPIWPQTLRRFRSFGSWPRQGYSDKSHSFDGVGAYPVREPTVEE